MKKVEPILDRMIRAGWAAGYVHNKNGFSVDWTPLGHTRMKSLSKSFNELFPTPLTPVHYAHLWGIVALYLGSRNKGK